MTGLGLATHDFPVGYTGILDVRPALAMTWGGASGSFFSAPGITQRNKEERSSAPRIKDFGDSRKNLTKLRAKRSHLPTLWTQSSFLVPL